MEFKEEIEQLLSFTKKFAVKIIDLDKCEGEEKFLKAHRVTNLIEIAINILEEL